MAREKPPGGGFHPPAAEIGLVLIIAELCTDFQTRVITKTKQLVNLVNFVGVAIVSAIVFGHLFNKRVVFCKLHSPLFK